MRLVLVKCHQSARVFSSKHTELLRGRQRKGGELDLIGVGFFRQVTWKENGKRKLRGIHKLVIRTMRHTIKIAKIEGFSVQRKRKVTVWFLFQCLIYT